jgi:hypothetical protein
MKKSRNTCHLRHFPGMAIVSRQTAPRAIDLHRRRTNKITSSVGDFRA